MKIKSIFTAAVALTLGLTACNKEESLSQDGLPENAVRITATIGNPFAATRSNPVGTVAEQAVFNEGDKIYVGYPTTSGGVVYQLKESKWITIDNSYLLWTQKQESFYAKYPLDDTGSTINMVPQDQSSLEKIALSDIMFAEIQNATKADVLNFVMQRQTSRIIINIAGFNAEFTDGSMVTDVRIVAYRPNHSRTDIYIPYDQGVGDKNSTYTLLKDASMDDLYVKLKVGDKEMTSSVLTNMQKGNSYTFNLVVGKEKLEIGSVSVADWTGNVTLPVGEAEELT